MRIAKNMGAPSIADERGPRNFAVSGKDCRCIRYGKGDEEFYDIRLEHSMQESDHEVEMRVKQVLGQLLAVDRALNASLTPNLTAKSQQFSMKNDVAIPDAF